MLVTFTSCFSDTGDVSVTANQWLQLDVGPATLITGLVTRGRGDGRRKHWVTKFRLSYSNDSQTWHFYKDAAHLHIKVRTPFLWLHREHGTGYRRS